MVESERKIEQLRERERERERQTAKTHNTQRD